MIQRIKDAINRRLPLRLKIRTLDARWNDRDDVMLHAAFQCLVDYLEQEDPDEIVGWDYTPHHRGARDEMEALYYWWTKVYPVISEEPEFAISGHEVEDEMLKRLVAVRGFLWT